MIQQQQQKTIILPNTYCLTGKQMFYVTNRHKTAVTVSYTLIQHLN